MENLLLSNISFFLGGFIAVIIWLVRLEAKVNRQAETFKDYKEVLELRELKAEAKFEKALERIDKKNEILQEIKERLVKVERDVLYLKRHWNSRGEV